MGRDRGRNKARARKENTREERKVTATRELLTFSFKELIQTQPQHEPETVELWQELNLMPTLMQRLKELSNLTRNEACQQQQIKIYGDFPPNDKTEFFAPKHIDQHVAWGVIEGLGGLPRVAGYISGDTFYIVFLDSKHVFWKSEKKHT
jgi:hypothetical protein